MAAVEVPFTVFCKLHRGAGYGFYSHSYLRMHGRILVSTAVHRSIVTERKREHLIFLHSIPTYGTS